MLLGNDIHKFDTYSFEVGPIRPPSEGGSYSLLIRATRNCPWNRCTFCYGLAYNRQKFQLRTVDEIKRDRDAAKALADEIRAASWRLGSAGNVNSLVGGAILQSYPWLSGDHSFSLVFNWLHAGAKTAFLQDANSLIIPTGDLLQVLWYLKETLPTLERITSYARAKTLAKKTLQDLSQLRQAGLTRLHVGLETGDDEVLKYVEKGVTAAEHIQAGRKAKKAGLELSEYVMPGLGGKAMWEQHARGTARILSETGPDFVRLRPFIPRPGTPMYDDYKKGDFELTSPHERLRELRILIQDLNMAGRVCFDHMMNSWYRDRVHREHLFKQDYEGYSFPEDKSLVLELIEEGLGIDESVHVHAEQLMVMPHL